MPSSKHTEYLIEQSNARAQQDNPSNAPPAYHEVATFPAPQTSSQAAPSSSSSSERQQPNFRDLTFISTPPNLPFSLYAPTGCAVSADRSTVTIRCPPDPRILRKAIDAQANLPPRIQLRIKGEHQGIHGKEIDFDLKFDMLRYFVSPATNGDDNKRSATNPYMRLCTFKTPQSPAHACGASDSETSRAMAAASVESFLKAEGPKSLSISRQVCNWNLEWLSERVHALASSVNYKGNLTIEPQCTMASTVRFVVDSSSKKRATAPWIAPFANLFEKSKKWEIDAIWPYANIQADEKTSRRAAADAGRECVVCDEDEWWITWKQVVRGGMLDKRNGWMGVEDWIDAAMKPADEDVKDTWTWFGAPASSAQPIQPWGIGRPWDRR